ncbi:MAG TPA: serine hydrolase domain-containing protein [Acidimicrobiales bacterium]|nr:serine hydrolase domain-containing protein [Acidimicrobiales bacterium]
MRYAHKLVQPMSTELVAAEDIGVDPKRLELFWARVQLEVDHGPLPSAQVAVARRGRLVAFETYGDATNGHRYILQSVGRNVVAAVTWKLLGEGVLELEEKVADVIPEFGTNGKDVVTVEQVLTHTGGFPFAPLGYPKMLDRRSRLEAFSRWRLDWEPGSRLQFHLTSAAWVIAELVERRTGKAFAEYLRTEIVEPLGLGFVLPLSVDRFHEDLAVPTATDRTSDDQEVDPWGPWYLANPEILAAGEPSHSIVGSAADLVLLGQALLHSGLWDEDTVADAIRIRRSEAPFGEQIYGGSPETANVGLFCMVSGEHGGNSFTPRSGSPRTFGHRGAPAQLAFTDAQTGTSFAFLTNGYPLAGYDYSLQGVNLVVNVGNLGNDLIA